MTFIDAFKSGLWPDGKLKPSGIPRSLDEKERTRDEANRKLSALMPGLGVSTSSKTCVLIISGVDLAANMIGRSNARRGARRIFAVLQNRRLNQHIVYTIIDEVTPNHEQPHPADRDCHSGVRGVIPRDSANLTSSGHNFCFVRASRTWMYDGDDL
jgi:hypothetical protein